MASSPPCSLVTDVTGGVEARTLTRPQVRLLASCAEAPPDRAMWMAGGRRLGEASGPIPANATHLLTYRLGSGAKDQRGEAVSRITTPVADLPAIAHLFAMPWRRLNAQGLDLAEASRPMKRLNTIAFRCTDEEVAGLQEVAEKAGVHVARIVREAVRAFVSVQTTS